MSTVHNFNAGPAVLPADVLRKAQNELLDYRGLGYSIMEASHRSKEFDAVISHAETNFGNNYLIFVIHEGMTQLMDCQRQKNQNIHNHITHEFLLSKSDYIL